MKKLLLIPILIASLTVLPSFTFNGVHAQVQPISGDECSTPTQFITIAAGPGIIYDTDKLELEKATCVKITLINKDIQFHDFTIDFVAGDEGITSVYILLDAGETASFSVLTPDVDVTFTYYCNQPGHRDGGMEGKFNVGEGSSEDDSPAFGFWITIMAFSLIVSLIVKKRN
ncbi:MAG: hypothetical protein HeimC2_07550 [Candidatus Heimdallarchaeota archaeon LC_2]|nr:MAG: hypothetical protein HeimC2_07550 [Candidatus Heimdallarchaeota archaeon LC_2]